MGKRSAYEIHRCQIDVVGVYTQLSDCRLHDVVVGLFQAQKKGQKLQDAIYPTKIVGRLSIQLGLVVDEVEEWQGSCRPIRPKAKNDNTDLIIGAALKYEQ